LLGNPGHANGFAAVIWPIAFTYVYAKAVVDLAATLLRTGTPASFHDRMIELMTLMTSWDSPRFVKKRRSIAAIWSMSI
jgi:2-methylisocitrate lyase-like PEP mutase family enzyme